MGTLSGLIVEVKKAADTKITGLGNKEFLRTKLKVRKLAELGVVARDKVNFRPFELEVLYHQVEMSKKLLALQV